MSYYKDLRQHLAALEERGKLVRIKDPINKDTELHPLVRLQFRGLPEEEWKAFLFENVTDGKGRNYDIPVAVGAIGASREIYAMGMMCKPDEIMDKWTEAQRHPIEPVMVSSGPVQEVVYSGDSLLERGGLDEFPIPISTPGYDIAPYFTSPYWVTKDPETHVRNVGTYRAQLKSPTRTGMYPSKPEQHVAIHWRKHRKLGIPMEGAIIVGATPNIGYVSVSRVATGVDEFSVAGGIAGEPVELVKCKTVDLEVPAHAEIVVEGIISTTEVEPEAPFGEALGYMGHREMTPYFTVICITHRKTPIWQSFISQLAPCESSIIKGLAWENNVFKYLRHDLNMTHVIKVANHASNLSQRMLVVQMKKAAPEEVVRTLEAAADYLPAQGKILIAVDEDINPYDANMVNWAITYRSQPHRDFVIQKMPAADFMDYSSVPPGEAMKRDTRFEQMPEQSRVLINATLKWAYPPISLPTREFMENALRLWKEKNLPQLKLREPWYGYSLGYWTEEDEEQAMMATNGEYYKTGEIIAKKRRQI